MRAPVFVVGLAIAGCDDLSSYTTGPNESYCGSVTLGAPFREGLSPRVQMRLTLDDATALDGPKPPGSIWTYEEQDNGAPAKRMLDAAPLRPIAALSHDPMSHLEFGDGRERNAIFSVSPAARGAESLLAVVSLRSDQVVEVRLVRGGAPEENGQEPPEGRRPIFGLFPLSKQNGTCGF